MVIGTVFQTVAATGDSNNLGMVWEAVKYRRPRWHIANQFYPVLQRPIGCHNAGFRLIPAHDDLKEILTGPSGQLLDAHVIHKDKKMSCLKCARPMLL